MGSILLEIPVSLAYIIMGAFFSMAVFEVLKVFMRMRTSWLDNEIAKRESK
jgi:hypothetical protein